MCFSALVKQNLKSLGLQFRARVDHGAFEDLFRRRLEGEDLKIAKALEFNYRRDPKTDAERRVRDLIEAWIERENSKDRAKIVEQEERLRTAEAKIAAHESGASIKKLSKKVYDDRRIAAGWIEKRSQWIERRSRVELKDGDSRIFPMWFFPMVYFDGKENVVAPFRYHLRPEGKPASFDSRFDGTYNARRDRLREVPWWKDAYGRHHGVFVVYRFFENVPEHRYHGRELKAGERESNMVVSFDPGAGREMLVPALFTRWRGAGGEPPVDGAAAITFDPAPEVAAAGHDRTVGRLKAQNVDGFLRPKGQSLADLEALDALIDDHEVFHFMASVAAAA